MQNNNDLFCSLLTPDDYLPSIYALDLLGLKSLGINGLLLDLDNTLVGRYETEPSLKCRSWIDEVKELGFSLCISSNSFYPNRVKYIAQSLGLPAFFVAAKPFPWGLHSAIEKILKMPADRVAIIGDQLFTDVVGGNIAGLYTVLVDPLQKDNVLGKIWMRKLEQHILKQYNIELNEGTIDEEILETEFYKT